MYLDPVADAAYIGNLQDNATARLIAAEQQIAAEITELLTVTVTKLPYKFISLPCVTYRDAPAGRIATTPIAEVVADECTGGKPLDALMAVIAGSTCPLVAELRKAIAARYVYANASDIAEVSL